jgi:hypothetical protein
MSGYVRVWEYASPETSRLYESDREGYAWDSLHAIASEYERGEIDWDTARARVDRDTRDMQAREGLKCSHGGGRCAAMGCPNPEGVTA